MRKRTTKKSEKNKIFINKLLNILFYSLIGIISSLGLFLLFYWSLRLNASIDNLIRNFYGVPLYFWPYVILTIGTLILFGINVPLLVYRWRKYGFPKLTKQAGGGLGAIIGVLASACPVCGSTLLSAIGVAGGLAVFPLQGLELKALSFGLMLVPFWLTTNELKLFAKGGKTCPVPKDPSLKKTEWPWLAFLLFQTIIFAFASWTMLQTDPAIARVLSNNLTNPNDNQLNSLTNPKTGNKIYDEVSAKVLPTNGYQSRISLGDAIVQLVNNGVIDKQKFEDIYKERGGLPKELQDALTSPSNNRIILTQANSTLYVNLLWPLGLSNYMSTNVDSPINAGGGKDLNNFASTGGWNLGKEQNGGAYFNKFKIVKLTPEQEALVTRLAKAIYRPCCDNSTFFQDCNHGSALLGVLELGASQGLSEDQLYKEALAFNSFWFPDNYIKTALYFKVKKNTDWDKVNPKEILSYKYSALSQWNKNVAEEVAKIPNLIPKQQGGGSCGT